MIRGPVLRSDSNAIGMTLIELLFVMGLLALLFGAGIGAFGQLNVGEQAARSTLETTLRAANNWAIARNAPAIVRLDRHERTISAEGMSVIGTWRFESMPVDGAFDLVGSKKGGAELDEDGYRGSALSFVGAPSNSRVKIDVQKDTAFPTQGRLRCKRGGPSRSRKRRTGVRLGRRPRFASHGARLRAGNFHDRGGG